MTSPRAERAALLRTQLATIITASDLPDADKIIVTSESTDVDKAPAQRYGVVFVKPYPFIEFPAPTITRLTWTVEVLGKSGRALEQFDRIDSIVEVLRRAIQFDSAEPVDSERPETSPLPGYAITLTDDYQD